MQQKDPDELLTTDDIATILRRGKTSVYSLLKEMQTIKVGQRIMVRRRDFDAWLATKTQGGVKTA